MGGGDYDRDSLNAVVARIETKVDQLLQTISHHEQKLGYLEKLIWVAIGGGAVIGFIISHAWK